MRQLNAAERYISALAPIAPAAGFGDRACAPMRRSSPVAATVASLLVTESWCGVWACARRGEGRKAGDSAARERNWRRFRAEYRTRARMKEGIRGRQEVEESKE